MFVDSHAHLQMPQFKDDLDEVLKRSLEGGLQAIMLIGSNEADSRAGVLLSEQHDFLYATVGIHPHDVKSATDTTYNNLRELVKSHKVHAYGEIGLDFFKNYSPRDVQIAHFKRQIELADELNLPLIVHIRDAYDECYDILREMEGRLKNSGVIHCFSSDIEHAKKFIDLGFYISFSGTVTYKNAEVTRAAAEAISTEHMLIETDCPYLSPVPYRGKRNEPLYVKEVAKCIAGLKGLSVEDIARITTRNANELFNIAGDKHDTEIVYKIRNSLYINMTNRCTNNCTFCARDRSYVVKGHNLKLDSEPGVDEVIGLIGDPKAYDEVVFCGYGEPLIRLDDVIAVSKYVKERGGRVRINTNGQGSLIHKKNILESLKGLVDEISVSLNAENKERYNEFCHSIFGENAYNGVKDFILLAKEAIPRVVVSVVEMPGVDVSACRNIAEKELGVEFRVRKLNIVG